MDERLSRKNENDSAHLETLFIPEDLSRYADILDHVRKLLERPESFNSELNRTNVDSVGKTDRIRESTREDLVNEKDPEDESLNLENLQVSGGDSRLTSNEKYSSRDTGGVPPRATVKNKGDAVTSTGNENHRNEEKTEPDEEDLLEAANFGLNAMKNLYFVTEPTLYSMGGFFRAEYFFKYFEK